MKVIYIASEGAPFAASGGLGDVIGALPRAVAEAGGKDMKTEVILPLYGSMKEEYRIRLVKEADIRFSYGWRQTGASVFSLTEGGVLYHFIENHYYFNRQKLYGEPDDGERFAFFSMAALEFMLATGDIPDVLHANDWQTAMAVIYLKTEYAHIEALRRIRTVFTIHNIEYQGEIRPLYPRRHFCTRREVLSYCGIRGLYQSFEGCSDRFGLYLDGQPELRM